MTTPAAQRSVASLGLILVAMSISTARLMQTPPLQSANDRSRWCTVWSLAERGTYRIDEIRQRPGWDTIDLVRHDGHFYSTKPPLFPTLVAGLYLGVEKATGWTLDDDRDAVAHLLLFVVNILPMALALGAIAWLAERFARGEFTRWFVMVAAAVGTMLTPFLLTLNNHTPGAQCVVLAIAAAVWVMDGRRFRIAAFALSGFFAAFACCFELPAALFGLLLFIMLWRIDARATWLAFVPAACVPLAGFFITNYLATGGWKPFYLYYGTEKYRFIHEGIPSYWMNPGGIDANAEPTWLYALHCTLGHHGIFSLSPMYLLSIVGWWLVRQRDDVPLKRMVWLGLTLSVSVFAFYMTKTENYNYGGVSVALRWMLWLTPFWLLAMIPVLDRWATRRWLQVVSVVLLCLSVYSAWSPPQGPWRQPWLYALMEKWEWIDYRSPPPELPRTLATWFPTLPDGDTADPQYWIEFESMGVDDERITLRLSDGGPQEIEGKAARAIEVQRTRGEAPPETMTYLLDAKSFNAGHRVSHVLLATEPPLESAADKQAALAFLRGFPADRAYRPGSMCYLKLPHLRADAFTTQHAASRVQGQATEPFGRNWHRCDVWLTAAVPFGVIQFEQTVTEGDTGTVLSQRRMVATRTGRSE